ncbi:MAG TPA: hypothetical protein ENJ82_17305, partial [Bacteroidetes bacterium]|nr:hypothetical protein [Bacteroidota bacterium]
MKKYWVLITGVFLIFGSLHGQQKYWLMFEDKGPETVFYETHPAQFLSLKALERRKRHHHNLCQADLPVSKTYIKQLRQAGVVVEAASKWLNAASVTTDLDYLTLQRICPAIVDMRPVGRYIRASYLGEPELPGAACSNPDSLSTTSFNYGATQTQQDLLDLPCLHNRGFTGSGVL